MESYALIEQSEFSYNGIGILAISSASFGMHDSMVVNNTQDGIHMFNSSSAFLFSGNVIDGNGGDGIEIYSSGSFSMNGTSRGIQRLCSRRNSCARAIKHSTSDPCAK
jgi:parallel beta-helix repeat protein